MNNRIFVALLTLLTISLVSTTAVAQENPMRSGFWGSFGLGWGSIGVSDDEERYSGGAAMLALGGTINPRFLVGGAVSNWVRTENDVTLNVGVVAPVLRFYPQETQNFYLQAGLGAGMAELQFSSITISEEGGGAMLGLGYDLMLSDSWGITPFANFSFVALDSDANLNFLQLGIAGTYH